MKQKYLNCLFILFGLLNVILMIIFLTINSFNIYNFTLFLIGLLPTFIWFISLILIKIYKNKTTLRRVLNILSIILIIVYIPFLFIWLILYSLTKSFNPENDINNYQQYSYNDYFPIDIPSNYIDASFYHSYPFLQAGEEIILYLKLEKQEILNYKNQFILYNNEIHKDMLSSFPISYRNTPYESNVIDNNFDIYIIESTCDDSTYCNHGLNKHVTLNENTNEIVFYYHKW